MLRGFRSTQIRTVPSFLGTTTIPAHQGAGTSTLEMTPKDSMHDSSSFTFLRSGSGMFLGVCRVKGVASGLRQIWNSPLSVPRPENRAINWVVMSPRSLGSVVTFILAFMADGFFCRTGATRVWALSTPGTILAALLLEPLLCCTCFGSVAAASPVRVYIVHHRLSQPLLVVEERLLLLDCFTLSDNLLGFFQSEIRVHLETLRQGTVADSDN